MKQYELRPDLAAREDVIAIGPTLQCTLAREMSTTDDHESIPLCSLCVRQVAGEASLVRTTEHSYQCVMCFGILDPEFISEVAEHVEKELTATPYDAKSFILALNLPVSQTLREIIIKQVRPDFNGILSTVPFKIRNIDAYIERLGKASGLRPTLRSDLNLTITFKNDEFDPSDLKFLVSEFPQLRQAKRRYDSSAVQTELSKQQLQQVTNKITSEIGKKYKLTLPSRKCEFSIELERDTIFIAGRYCKFSRSLPQSPWSVEEKDGFKQPGNSVSEKVCDILKARFGASDSTFIASGREDIDVRMLGDGRPFAIELKNCRFTNDLQSSTCEKTLAELELEINKALDIKVYHLTRITRDQTAELTKGQEEKRKSYTAFCYSTLPIAPDAFIAAKKQAPIKMIQKTPVRVLKRRSLLDRERSVYTLDFVRIDEHHFLTRLETEAGTYIKEFVHGDFGRTVPSLADLLGVANGEVDILELDVEKVDLEWPPK